MAKTKRVLINWSVQVADPDPSGEDLSAFLQPGEVLGETVAFQNDGVWVDATLSFDAREDVEVTTHPVEEGFKSTDHLRPKPVVVTLEGMFSNTSAIEADARSASESGLTKVAQESYAKLQKAKDDSQLVQIATVDATYSEMAISSLRRLKDPSTGDAVRFSLTATNVRIVNSQTVELKPTKVSASPKKDVGGQGTKTVEKERYRSFLDQAADRSGAYGALGVKP